MCFNVSTTNPHCCLPLEVICLTSPDLTTLILTVATEHTKILRFLVATAKPRRTAMTVQYFFVLFPHFQTARQKIIIRKQTISNAVAECGSTLVFLTLVCLITDLVFILKGRLYLVVALLSIAVSVWIFSPQGLFSIAFLCPGKVLDSLTVSGSLLAGHLSLLYHLYDA